GAKWIGIKGIIEWVFPECVIKEWKAEATPEPQGIRGQIIDHILAELGKGKECLSWSSVRSVFGIKQQSNFKKLYLKDELFQHLCDDFGIIIDHDRFSFCRNPFVTRNVALGY